MSSAAPDSAVKFAGIVGRALEAAKSMIAPKEHGALQEMEDATMAVVERVKQSPGITPEMLKGIESAAAHEMNVPTLRAARDAVAKKRTLMGAGALVAAGGIGYLADRYRKKKVDRALGPKPLPKKVKLALQLRRKRLVPPQKPPLSDIHDAPGTATEDNLRGDSGDYNPGHDAKHATLLPGGVPGQVGSLRTMARGASFGLGNGMPGAVASRVSRARAAHPQLMGKVMDRTGEASGLNPVGRVVMNARRVPEAIKRRVGLGPKPVVTQTRVAHADLPPEVLAAMNKKGSIAPNTVREQPSFVGTTRRRGRDPGMEQVLSHPPKVVKNRFLGIPIGSMGKVATLRPGGMKGGIGTWRKMEGMALEGARAFTPAAGAKSHKGITALSKKTNLVKRMERASARHPQYVQGMSKGFEERLGQAFAEGTSKHASLPLPVVKARNVVSHALTGGARAQRMSHVPDVRFRRGLRPQAGPGFSAGAYESGGMQTNPVAPFPRTPGGGKRMLDKAVAPKPVIKRAEMDPGWRQELEEIAADPVSQAYERKKKRQFLSMGAAALGVGFMAGFGARGRLLAKTASYMDSAPNSPHMRTARPKVPKIRMSQGYRTERPKFAGIGLPAARFYSVWRGEPGFQEEFERQKVAYELPDDWAPRRVFVRQESPPMPAVLAGFLRCHQEKIATDVVQRFMRSARQNGLAHSIEDLESAWRLGAHTQPRTHNARFATIPTRVKHLGGKSGPAWSSLKKNVQARLPMGTSIPGQKGPDALAPLKR